MMIIFSPKTTSLPQFFCYNFFRNFFYLENNFSPFNCLKQAIWSKLSESLLEKGIGDLKNNEKTQSV